MVSLSFTKCCIALKIDRLNFDGLAGSVIIPPVKISSYIITRYVPTVHLVYCFDVDIIIVASVNKLANKAVESEDYENIHHQQSPTLSAIK